MRSRIYIFIILSELLVIVVILKLSNNNNTIMYLLFNLVRSFLIFIRVLIDNYDILILANMLKLGLFPFTHLIYVFYLNLNIQTFIILNICKLPYLSLISMKFRTVLILITLMYAIYLVYRSTNVIQMITVYRVTSRVIMLNLQKQNLSLYYLIRLLSIYLCFIRRFEIVRVYNLIRLPFRLTFYIKIQFLISLRLLRLMWIIVTLTFVILFMVKYITSTNKISKGVSTLLVLNSIMV